MSGIPSVFPRKIPWWVGLSIFVLAGVMLSIAFLCGYASGQNRVWKEAVERGYGEFYPASERQILFRWSEDFSLPGRRILFSEGIASATM